MAKLATRPLVTSTNTHRRKRRASSLGRSSNDRAAPLTQPLLRASCPVSNTRLLSLHRRYADLFPPCYAVAMWMRRMNGSCRRAWTGLPTILPPAPWGLAALTCRPDRATCSTPSTHPRLMRTVPCRPRKGSTGSVMHNSLAIEPSCGWAGCFPCWDVLSLPGRVLFNVESRASSVDTPGALRRKRAPFASAPGHICFADGSLSLQRL